MIDLSNSLEISFSIKKLFFSRAKSQRIKEDDISNYVLYDDDEENDNESSMFDNTNYSNEAFSNAFWNIFSIFISNNEDIIFEFENEKKIYVTRNNNELKKTKYILKMMNRFRISFIKFFVTTMRSNTKIAKTFANKLHEKKNSNLFKKLMIRKNKTKKNRLKIFEIINWQTMLRRKIVNLFFTIFFEKFDVKEYFEKFKYKNLQIVVEKILQSNVFFYWMLFTR